MASGCVLCVALVQISSFCALWNLLCRYYKNVTLPLYDFTALDGITHVLVVLVFLQFL